MSAPFDSFLVVPLKLGHVFKVLVSPATDGRGMISQKGIEERMAFIRDAITEKLQRETPHE